MSDKLLTVKNQGKPRGIFPRKLPGQVSSSTKRARDLFLHGNGDGMPVTNTIRLAALAGIHPATVEKWRPVWERERVALAQASTGKGNLGKPVTANDLHLHDANVLQLQTEMERLKCLLPTLSVGTDAHRDTLKLYTATVKAWTEESGLRAHFETGAAYVRELARTAARATKTSGEGAVREVSGFDFSITQSSKDGIESLLGE